ncbi:MAG: hypothetical protein NTW68_02895 [candidate division NC10 bacterium]|nr:hypothetical protein [candidate division NC10 bacterium]
MPTRTVDIDSVLTNLEEQVSRAVSKFIDWSMTGDPWDEPSWNIEACFIQLLAALEALGMPELRNGVYAKYAEIKTSSEGFSKSGRDPNDEPYSPVLGGIRLYTSALRGLLPSDKRTTVTKDLLDIIRNVHYVITDKAVFPEVPQNEKEVHSRIEAILKCVFPDLKHKPSLSKQIKNFEPDTGIPSLRTLIEYKFLSRKADVGVIADQLLADTRGYTSKDWERFLYVVYETNRFKTESDWNQLMRESGVPLNATVVVLSGEPHPKARAIQKGRWPQGVGQRARRSK